MKKGAEKRNQSRKHQPRKKVHQTGARQVEPQADSLGAVTGNAGHAPLAASVQGLQSTSVDAQPEGSDDSDCEKTIIKIPGICRERTLHRCKRKKPDCGY